MTTDFSVVFQGTVTLFRLNSDSAREWWSENVADRPSFGRCQRVVEWRYAGAIWDGIVAAGLTIEQVRS